MQQRVQPRGNMLSSNQEAQPDLRAWSQERGVPQRLFACWLVCLLYKTRHFSVDCINSLVYCTDDKRKILVFVLSVFFFFFYNSANHNFVNQTRVCVLESRWMSVPLRGKYGEISNIMKCHLLSGWIDDWLSWIIKETSTGGGEYIGERQMRCCCATFSWGHMNEGPLTPERAGMTE